MARSWRKAHEDGAAWKGLVAGAVGGLVASFVMNRSHDLWRALDARLRGPRRDGDQDHQGGGKDEAAELPGDDTTGNTAEVLWRLVLGREPTERERRVGGALVHYGFGAATGALYGGLGERLPLLRLGAGAPYGAAVWLLADEIAMPLLHLSRPAKAYALGPHAASLASHLVYGVSLDLTRRLVRGALGK
jgi:putative membrane protein